MKQVQFHINLTNTGSVESAIVLMLTVEHSRPQVFSDQLTVVYVDSVSFVPFYRHIPLHIYLCIHIYVSELRPLTVLML